MREGVRGTRQGIHPHLIKMVVLNGIYDEDIRKEVLGMTTLDNLNLNDTVGLIVPRNVPPDRYLTTV